MREELKLKTKQKNEWMTTLNLDNPNPNASARLRLFQMPSVEFPPAVDDTRNKSTFFLQQT